MSLGLYIPKMPRLYIPELFTGVINAVNENVPFPVYYKYGHLKDIAQQLSVMDQSPNEKEKKYPLIWLVMDFVERKTDIEKDYFCELAQLQFIIGNSTDSNWSMEERRDKNFLSILYPIYEEFLYQLMMSGDFTCISPESIPHEKIDRPYWSGEGSGKTNLWNDTIDAIQIRNMQLFVNIQNR